MQNNNQILFTFQGQQTLVQVTLVNPYSGEEIEINEVKNLNTSTYHGTLGSTNVLIMSDLGDTLFIEDSSGNQTISNIQTISAGDSGDVLQLASLTFILGDITINGGTGDDILWSNAGNDSINGASGDDIIDGGLGDDILDGGTDNDRISGGDGNDILIGSTGQNTLIGGTGSDTYLVGRSFFDGFTSFSDTIIERSSSDINVIEMTSNLPQNIPNFTIDGNDLIITFSPGAVVRIEGQFDAPDSGIDTLKFADGSTFDLRTISNNEAPEAQDDQFSINEDDVLNDNVLGNDTDPNTDILTVLPQSIITAAGATVELLANGDFTYTPAANFNGADSFTYTVTDGDLTDTATVDLTVNAVNDDPVANDDSFAGNEDNAITGNVLGNDTDIDLDTLSAVAETITTAAGATVELLANGDFTYTPAANFNGADSFTYTVTDGDLTDTATVSLNIVADNIIEATTGDDILNGTGGDDIIEGSAGIDHLIGNANNDTLNYFGDATWSNNFGALNVGSIDVDGTEQLVRIGGKNRSFDQFDGGEGIDTLNLTNGDDALFLDDSFSDRPTGTSGPRVSSIEVINAGDGDDVIDLTSNNFDYGDVTLNGDDGNDTLWSSAGRDSLNGGEGNDSLFSGAGNDTLNGDNGNDTLMGSLGDDVLNGGEGNDILYGGNNDDLVILDKDFQDDIVFPELKERTDIKDLRPPGTPALGIADGNLSIDYQATASITFNKGGAGYRNTFGVYEVAADGTIQNVKILFDNVKDAGFGVRHDIDLPVGENGGEFGFFIIGNGFTVNKGFKNIDVEADNVISVIYNYGQADARLATVDDNGVNISVVYNDGVTETVLKGPAYFTTDRGGDGSLNADGEVHVVSGLIEEGNSEILGIGFEDLYNLGDADYEDVFFDLDIHEKAFDVSENGNDILNGGAGEDVLYGEAGDDILNGGADNDILHGGSGNDTFVFGKNGRLDTISLFENGDRFDLSDLVETFNEASDAIADFVTITSNGDGTHTVSVDADGTGTNHTAQDIAIVTFENDTMANVDTLNANGNIIL